jgi:Zn-dependent protease
MVLVAAAGPAMNLLLALGAGILYHAIQLMPAGLDSWLAGNLGNAIKFNVLLAVFNMLPIPPLDGGRVAVGLLPDALAYPLARLERVGIFIVLGVFLLLPMLMDELNLDFDPVHYLLLVPADAVIRLILTVTGVA